MPFIGWTMKHPEPIDESQPESPPERPSTPASPRKKAGRPKGSRNELPGTYSQLRAAKLVKGLLAGQRPKEAAKAAGYAAGPGSSSVYEIIKRPYVQSLLTDAINRAGIGPDDLAMVVKEGLGAVKVFNTKHGPIVLADQPDHDARFAAYDRITNAFGLVPHKTEMPGATAPGLTVNISQSGGPPAKPTEIDPTAPSEPMTVNISVQKP